MQSSHAIAGVQRAVKDLLVWQATVVQHNQTYEIMHLAWVFFFKWENEIGSLFSEWSSHNRMAARWKEQTLKIS